MLIVLDNVGGGVPEFLIFLALKYLVTRVTQYFDTDQYTSPTINYNVCWVIIVDFYYFGRNFAFHPYTVAITTIIVAVTCQLFIFVIFKLYI